MDNYAIIESPNLAGLQKQVDLMIDEGFLPQGGVGVNNYYEGTVRFVQAMLRHPLIPKENQPS
jgi:hypothetical protein